jgi:hypothetical protein
MYLSGSLPRPYFMLPKSGLIGFTSQRSNVAQKWCEIRIFRARLEPESVFQRNRECVEKVEGSQLG